MVIEIQKYYLLRCYYCLGVLIISKKQHGIAYCVSHGLAARELACSDSVLHVHESKSYRQIQSYST